MSLEWMEKRQVSIGRDAAIAMAKSGWWEKEPLERVVMVGLFTKELCIPLGVLHPAVEKYLGRPVWLHEFAFDELYREVMGEKGPPTIAEIIGLLPPEKLLVL